MKIYRGTAGAIAAVALLSAPACDLDLTNPNAPTEEEIITDVNGILAVGVGLQGLYAGSVLTYVRAPALVTDEWGTAGSSLLSDRSLLLGEDVLDTYLVVTEPYSVTYEIIRTANTILTSVPQIDRLSPGSRLGLSALAKLFKGMALGAIIQQYREVAVDADVEGAVPEPRGVVLGEVLGLLESARSDLAGVSDQELATLRDRVLGGGFDLHHTIDAMLARFYLIDGQFESAITAAERVDPGVLSIFDYPSPDINPIYNYSILANYIAPLKSFVDQAEPGDQRPAFWVEVDGDPVDANPPDTLLLPLNQYSTRNDPFPVYLPDEMKLIRAEAHARLGNLVEAIDLINEVRTPCESALEEPVACLPPVTLAELPRQDDVLRQISYERRYELYAQGLRWEDLRRFAGVVDRAPSIDFLPFPGSECDANPNAGC
ncbi:MAG: RagB/SusD family nutrient uptake outer membrane protein [Longimicrobiaceae bacterium]